MCGLGICAWSGRGVCGIGEGDCDKDDDCKEGLKQVTRYPNRHIYHCHHLHFHHHYHHDKNDECKEGLKRVKSPYLVMLMHTNMYQSYHYHHITKIFKNIYLVHA